MSRALPPGWEGLLDEDERILWQGTPNGGLTFRSGDLAQSAFGLVFAGFAVFWIATTSSMGSLGNAPAIFRFFPLFGLPFLAIGLHMAFGRYIWQAFQRRHTHYTLTSKRGFIATQSFGSRSLKSYPLGELELQESARGDTLLFTTHTNTRRGKNGHRRTVTKRIGFELIPDGRKVYQRARKALKEPST